MSLYTEKTLKKILAFLFVSVVSSAHAAQDAKAALQQFLDGVQTFEAHFEQTQADEKGKLVQSASGRVWLARGAAGTGKFRWDYQKPYAQQIVSDGKKIWLYDPDLAQVTVRSAADMLKGTPAALLSQGATLAAAFTLEDAGMDGSARRLRLRPKNSESAFQSIELSLHNGAPVRMKFFDQLGGVTDLHFSAGKVNAKTDATRFEFTPPAGVEVVDTEAAVAP